MANPIAAPVERPHVVLGGGGADGMPGGRRAAWHLGRLVRVQRHTR